MALIALLLGPIIGSFLAVAVERVPLGRSYCPHCRTTLRPLELIPILSWLWLRGRCRSCGAVIGLFPLALELLCLLVAGWAALVTTGPPLWASCLLGWPLVALAAIDLRDQRLPDRLTLPLIALGLAVNSADWPDHLAGALLGYLVFTGIAQAYRHWRHRDGLGAGDAKLLAALGAWLAWPALPMVILLAALMGLGWVLLRALAGRPLALTDRLPFGPFLALAGWLMWLYGPWVEALNK